MNDMDICDELEARWGTVHGGAFSAMRNAKREIEMLRAWVKQQGEQTDICTFNVLKKKCDWCRCGRTQKE